MLGVSLEIGRRRHFGVALNQYLVLENRIIMNGLPCRNPIPLGVGFSRHELVYSLDPRRISLIHERVLQFLGLRPN